MPGNNKKVNILKPVSESHKFVTYVWPFCYHQELVLILTDRLILKLFNGYLLAKAINQKPSKTWFLSMSHRAKTDVQIFN